MFTLSLKATVFVNESKFKFPDVVVIVLPLILTLPDCISLPEIVVTSEPVVNVKVESTSMFKSALVKLTCPVC